MGEYANAATIDLKLEDEPSLAPSMPATETAVSKAEDTMEGWAGQFKILRSNAKVGTPSRRSLFIVLTIIQKAVLPAIENAGHAPAQITSFPLNTDQIWYDFAANEFEMFNAVCCHDYYIFNLSSPIHE